MQLAGDSLELLPDAGQFARERIYMIVPYDQNRILIGTRTKGLLLFDGSSFIQFTTEAEQFLLDNQIYHGAALNNGLFAIATLRGGMLVIDKDGRVRQIINQQSGLQDESVKFIYPGPSRRLVAGAKQWHLPY